MTHVRDALAAARARIAQLPKAFVPPPVSATGLLAQRLGAQSTAVTPPEDALRALYTRLQTAFRTRNMKALRSRDLRDAPWILWDRALKGSAISGLLDAVVSHAKDSNRTTRNLIEAWIRGFSVDDASIAAAGQAIRLLLKGRSDSRLDIWQKADQRFELFDAHHGPKSLARALVAGPGDPDELIKAAGFDDPVRATGGYMRAVLLALLGSLPEKLRGRDADAALSRALHILAPADQLRFGTALRGEIGHGLLAPWLDREPSPSQRDRIRDFLLMHIGDPRLRPSDWTAVGERETRVMRSWLARATLRAFFGLIAEYALDRQWRHRDAFWSAYLEKGAIDDAWLALGRQVFASARGVDELKGGYGRLEGSAPNQSILLLRIGPLIICEWSHNGAIRAWRTDSREAPRMYRTTYHRSELVKQCLAFPPAVVAVMRRQTGPASGSPQQTGDGLRHQGPWQVRAAALIAREAGIRIGEVDWIPR